jgi:predicted nicotinamide N-methyase
VPSSSIWSAANEGCNRAVVDTDSCTTRRSTSPPVSRTFHHTSAHSGNFTDASNENVEFPDRKFIRGSSTDASSSSSSSSFSASRDTAASSALTSIGGGLPLLLEGDSYHVSNDGIARTLYRFRGSVNVPFAVEECYALSEAKKSFLLRRDPYSWDAGSYGPCHRDGGIVSLGACFQQVSLQEIDYGAHGSAAGTGATTWESSILMAMYFGAYPTFLVGDVIELGSGVGLGGMLCAMKTSRWALSGGDNTQAGASPIQSLTVTDVNPMVLEQCRENFKALDQSALASSVQIAKLDWYDFLSQQSERSMLVCQKYDTVIACDCAYRHRDIEALACTIASLLRNQHSQAHIFAPSNRIGLEQLLGLLRVEHEMRVTVESLEMERFRLAPIEETTTNDTILQCPYATSHASSFLHIICSPKISGGVLLSKDPSDID